MIRIAIVGAGPAGLMALSRLAASKISPLHIEIFEKGKILGSGMPYSEAGAMHEHVTNVSSDELPVLTPTLVEWVKSQHGAVLQPFNIKADSFHEKEVVPRLLFGQYLNYQFEEQIKKARERSCSVVIHLNTEVIDIYDSVDLNEVQITTNTNYIYNFEHVIVCSGHSWNVTHEGQVDGYFDSPYPPSKLSGAFNHKVVIRGSSLTAIDAIKTVAANNGKFYWADGKYVFEQSNESPNFSIEMHSRDGMLPSLRIHMDEPHVNSNSLIEKALLDQNMEENGGFLSLDFLFEEGFKKPLKESSVKAFDDLKHMNIEEFVETMLSHRHKYSAFELLRREYDESLKSIEKEESIAWKEMLGSLSFAMNYPAKHLSAEDMLRLKKLLLPLISVVIAFMPQSSCETLLALYEAGCLDLKADGTGGSVEIDNDGKIVYLVPDAQTEEICQTFIDCIGQKHLELSEFPFASLRAYGTVKPARIAFKNVEQAKEYLKSDSDAVEYMDGKFYLKVPGLAVDDCFAVVNADGKASTRIYLMAVPHIGGFNPDYSGLDFCEQASKRIISSILAGYSVREGAI